MPKLLSSSFASWYLINLEFLLPHIAHFENIIALPLLVLETSGSTFSVFFYTLNNMIPFYRYAFFIKYFKVISSFFLTLFGEKRFVNSVKVFPLSIKSINPIQKHLRIIELYVYILKIIVVMDKERPVIHLGRCSTQKLSK